MFCSGSSPDRFYDCSEISVREIELAVFTSGALLTFTGLMLSTWIPINKSIWTTPYAVFTSGLAFTVFGCCYWLVDVLGRNRYAKPFRHLWKERLGRLRVLRATGEIAVAD